MPSNPVPPVTRKERNLAMEFCKFLTAFFVIYIHTPFPGTIGAIISGLASFAVPMFFMISGFFNYQASSAQIRRRTWHIVKLLLIATFAYLLYGCIVTETQGGSTIAYLRAAIPDPVEILLLVVHHTHPYSGHLWYLIAAVACYLVFYLFTRFREEGNTTNQPFYILCLCLFCVAFAFDTLPSAEPSAQVMIYTRTGWFAGIPMFGLGMFFREYQDVLFRALRLNTGKLLAACLIGSILTILQTLSGGQIGLYPFGTLIFVTALMLLLISHPTMGVHSVSLRKWILTMGALSTWIYLFHMLVALFYLDFIREPATAALGEENPVAVYLFVAVLSLAIAIVCHYSEKLWKRLKKQK